MVPPNTIAKNKMYAINLIILKILSATLDFVDNVSSDTSFLKISQ
jgi:hypothetical protein